MRLFYLPRQKKGQATRVGIVVSKKSAKVGQAAGRIADRNRVKRILRETARQILKNLPPGLDVVVQARPGVVKLAPGQVRGELRELLSALK